MLPSTGEKKKKIENEKKKTLPQLDLVWSCRISGLSIKDD